MEISSSAQFAITELVPAHSLEAEACVLGCMIGDQKACEEVLMMLAEEDFYSPAHREIFKSTLSLNSDRKAVDLVTVINDLEEKNLIAKVGGRDYVVQVTQAPPSYRNAEHYAQIVVEKSLTRKLETSGHEIVQIARTSEGDASEKLDQAESVIFQLGRQRLGKDLIPVRSLAKDFFQQIDDLYETGVPIRGIPTRFFDMDEMLGGFYGGEMTILAARPSMGKTSLVLNYALNVARQNIGSVAIFSLEMGGSQLIRRMISMLSGVSMDVLRREKLPDATYQSLADACESLYSLPIFIDDSSDLSPMELRGKCRRLKQEHGLSLVIVDYLQLMRSHRRAENRVQEVSEIARGIKAVAKEFDVPVLALSQLSRAVENRDDKRPMLSDLRESGSIEAEADLVTFIYRDAYYKAKESHEDSEYDPNAVEEAEIIIAKNRNGPTGKVVLGFQSSYARFVNLQIG